MVIAGDFEVDQAVDLVNRYLARVPPAASGCIELCIGRDPRRPTRMVALDRATAAANDIIRYTVTLTAASGVDASSAFDVSPWPQRYQSGGFPPCTGPASYSRPAAAWCRVRQNEVNSGACQPWRGQRRSKACLGNRAHRTERCTGGHSSVLGFRHAGYEQAASIAWPSLGREVSMPKDSHFRRWGAAYLLFALFLASWAGQFISMLIEVGNQAREHGQQFQMSEFWPAFWSATSSVLRAPPLALVSRHVPGSKQPWVAGLFLFGMGVASGLAPYLTLALKGVDARIPFAMASVALASARQVTHDTSFALARTLLQRGIDAAVFVIGSVAEVRGDARTNLDILGRLGVTVVEIDDEQSWELHFSEISQCTLIVDAIFGTGLKAAVAGMMETVIAHVAYSVPGVMEFSALFSKDVTALLLLVAILAWKPRGLFAPAYEARPRVSIMFILHLIIVGLF